MLKKLFLVPWIGDYPQWFDKYTAHIQHLQEYGYDFLFEGEDEFADRVERVLGFSPTLVRGDSLSHNYRTAFGLLYAQELEGYDFWGITDLDCVYGKPDNFVGEPQLQTLDIWSNHYNYICGPWTLFRNNDTVNNLFREVPGWEGYMRATTGHHGRWTEVEYSQVVDKAHEAGTIKRLYTHFQGKDPNDNSHLSMQGGCLFDGDTQVMTVHFNRTKIWPL